MMLDNVLVESVGDQTFLWSEQLELWTRYEPQQITLATAVRAIAFHGLLQTALDFERYLAAVTATFVVHSRAPKSDGFSDANARIERVPEESVTGAKRHPCLCAPLACIVGATYRLPVLSSVFRCR